MSTQPSRHALHSATTALLLIDLQEVYFESPVLRARRAEIVAACNQLIEVCKARRMYVLNIQTVHERDQSTWTLNMRDDKQGYLFAGDRHTRTLEDLAANDLPILLKTRDSAFFATDLAQRLNTLGIRNLILAGVSTHTCVAQTAADAYAANFRVMLAREAIASHVPAYHEPTLRLLKDEYRQQAISNQAILREDDV